MTASVRVASVEAPGDVSTVAVPVARDDEGLIVPRGLPDAFAGVALPSVLDATWCATQGFDGKARQSLVLRAVGQPSLVLVGIGDAALADAEVWRQFGAAAVRAAGRSPQVTALLPLDSTIPAVETVRAVVEGALLAADHAGAEKTSREATKPTELAVVPFSGTAVSAEDLSTFEHGAREGETVAAAVCWARDLINRPAAQCTPRRFAHEALRRLEDDPGMTVEIWREAELERERLGSFLGVSRGSLEPPRLVRATYTPEGVEGPPHVVLVGKGITFDSGGLNLKSFEGMTTMKTDMSGAAVVLGALSAIARLGARAKVTAIAPLTENLPGHKAVKPGDVLTARSGTTIEVLNTDAEGRLVLADGLTLATELDPVAIIDVATLTGAARGALGVDVAAILGTDPDLVGALRAAGDREGEQLWELPLVDRYDCYLDSEVADVKNIGKPGQAGTIVAALFLRRFAAGRPWAHLDIAGTGRAESDDGYLVKGATAFSLRTLVSYVLTL